MAIDYNERDVPAAGQHHGRVHGVRRVRADDRPETPQELDNFGPLRPVA